METSYLVHMVNEVKLVAVDEDKYADFGGGEGVVAAGFYSRATSAI